MLVCMKYQAVGIQSASKERSSHNMIDLSHGTLVCKTLWIVFWLSNDRADVLLWSYRFSLNVPSRAVSRSSILVALCPYYRSFLTKQGKVSLQKLDPITREDINHDHEGVCSNSCENMPPSVEFK